MPVFIVPTVLLPPFSRIHTDDLSKWTGEANDPTWIKLVDRIAKLIGREGVAAAARAVATGDDQALYEFAQRYPDEPMACKIWKAAEARHREYFERRMVEAKAAAEARIIAERAALDLRLEAATPAFESWLADERRSTAKGPRPDPLRFIEHQEDREPQRLRDEIAALQSSLEQAKAKERDLDVAKLEIARLSEELITALERTKATEADLDKARAEIKGLSQKLEAASEQAKAKHKDLNFDKETIARLSGEMAKTVEIRLPDIGDFKDVPVIEVLVKAGDVVIVDQIIVTLEF